MAQDHAPDTGSTRDAVIERYSGLARAALAGGTIADCDPGAFSGGGFAAAYRGADDVPEAALRASLGCGNPLAVASLQPGETVLDLGSGGGLDVLLSARRVAPDGIAYGLDASADMLTLARANAARAGITNIRFLRGHIEDIPMPGGQIDVVISNCVINLSTDKPRVLAEAFRILRPGGRIGITDVVTDDHPAPADQATAGSHGGCIAGALSRIEYLDSLTAAGFADASVILTGQAGPGMHTAIIRAVKPAGQCAHDKRPPGRRPQRDPRGRG